MYESLILVDQYGRRTGVAGRDVCHQGMGMRHRAFVVFLSTNDGLFLVQKRSGDKLGGDRWDVSATSHVMLGETYGAAIHRCLNHELGITEQVSPRYMFAYDYRCALGDSAENEHCSSFLIQYNGPIKLNTSEADVIRWVKYADLKGWFEQDEIQFTRWFAEAFRRMIEP